MAIGTVHGLAIVDIAQHILVWSWTTPELYGTADPYTRQAAYKPQLSTASDSSVNDHAPTSPSPAIERLQEVFFRLFDCVPFFLLLSLYIFLGLIDRMRITGYLSLFSSFRLILIIVVVVLIVMVMVGNANFCIFTFRIRLLLSPFLVEGTVLVAISADGCRVTDSVDASVCYPLRDTIGGHVPEVHVDERVETPGCRSVGRLGREWNRGC